MKPSRALKEGARTVPTSHPIDRYGTAFALEFLAGF